MTFLFRVGYVVKVKGKPQFPAAKLFTRAAKEAKGSTSTLGEKTMSNIQQSRASKIQIEVKELEQPTVKGKALHLQTDADGSDLSTDADGSDLSK